MKKSVVLSIAVFCIIVIGIFAINAQSPTPSPTSSPSPTPTTSATPISSKPPCVGIANFTVIAERQKTFEEEDYMEALKNNIKSMSIEINNNPLLHDFIKCKYPSSFTCPDYCYVNFQYYITGSITPSTGTSSMDIHQQKFKGSVTITLNVVDLAAIFFGGLFDKEAALNYVMPTIMNEINSAVNNLIKNAASCPEGYGRMVVVTIGQYSVNNHFPLYVTITVPYTIDVYCVKITDYPGYANLKLNMYLQKTCDDKQYIVTATT